MTRSTGTSQLLMLDPMPESEIEFVSGFLPENKFTVVAPDPAGKSNLDELLATADILVTKGEPVTAELLVKAPNLKLVQKYGGRPDRLDLEAARKANVKVALMPLCGCIAVAELAMAMILALSKQLIDGHEATKSGAYRELDLEPFETSQRKHAFQWMRLPNLQEVRRKTLGIVGFGEIGTEVAKRARAFEMDVIYYKREPLPASIEESLSVTRKPLDELMAESDFISIHVPHGPGTDPLIGESELGKMKPSAYLINSSRGPVVDEAALIDALRSKTITGAGLDVFDYEPLPHDNPLTDLDNVILAPHIGGGTGGAREKQMGDVLDNVIRFANGEKPRNQIV